MTRPVEPNIYITALRHAVSSVNIVTTRLEDGTPIGLTATAVTSVSADPAMILCCLNSETLTSAEIIRRGFFGINILSSTDQDLATAFASPAARETRFDHGVWTSAQTSAPLLESAVAALDCELEDHCIKGSHVVLFGRVVDAKQSESETLVYSHGSYGIFQPHKN